jgi:hypothetical protein
MLLKTDGKVPPEDQEDPSYSSVVFAEPPIENPAV